MKIFDYDAIVVGTGVSGGWAAKELCEKGLKTLVLERGRMVEHIKDYPTMNDDHWDYPAGDVKQEKLEKDSQNKTELVKLENILNIFLLTILIILTMK